jgi:hypothetical protein
MNDAHILQISSLHQKATNGYLVQIDQGENGIKPYIIVDKGYPLLPWLMIFHKQGNVRCTILELLFNRQFSREASVVENSFGILKKSFRELLLKTNLHVIFLLSVVVCCCILYNMILEKKGSDIVTLMA